MPKDSFLDILRRRASGDGSSSSAPEVGAAGRASFLRDDYLISKKQRTKDYEADIAEDEEDLEEENDELVGFDDDEF